MTTRSLKASFILSVFCLGVFVFCLSPTSVLAQEHQNSLNTTNTQVAHQPTATGGIQLTVPIMSLDDVRIGMKGYGLTVFHGTKIEPFAVEVISVQRDFSPQRGVVWIRCPDPRMQLSGPVHGMSGSPIYLWPLGEDHPLGQGGRLIGAFAFGYEGTKDCYVGVQPIEYMMQAASRLAAPTTGTSTTPKTPDTKSNTPPLPIGNPALGAARLQALVDVARGQGLGPIATWQATLLAKILNPTSQFKTNPKWWQHDATAATTPSADLLKPESARYFSRPAAGLPAQGRPMRLMIPLKVGSSAVAQTMAGLLEPLGLEPLANANNILAGRPPSEINPDAVQLEPGSVLAVPLAWGDADLSASGTVTALTTDGRILGFGHAMFGDGATNLPLATGYVHLVMPSISSSFKLGSSLKLKGALLRDEQSAVVGSTKGKVSWAPVRVRVKMPGQPVYTYNYQIVHHRDLTPILGSIVSMQSVTAAQSPAPQSTLHLQATLQYENQQAVNIDTMLPTSEPSAIASQIMPVMALMADNPFQNHQIQSLDVSIDYQPGIQTEKIIRGVFSKPIYRPGETAELTLWLQPYGQNPRKEQVSIVIPESLHDGDYPMVIGGSESYVSMLLGTRPYLAEPTNFEALFKIVKQIMETDNTALYVMLQTARTGLAIHQQELEKLPSSQRAILTGSNSAFATEYTRWLEKKYDTSRVIDGQQLFTLQVRKSGDLVPATP